MTTLLKSVSIGTDPEFLLKRISSGRFTSAEGLVPNARKGAPMPLEEWAEEALPPVLDNVSRLRYLGSFGVHEDNVSLELNVPAMSFQVAESGEVQTNLPRAIEAYNLRLRHAVDLIQQRLARDEVTIHSQYAGRLPKVQLETAQARTFGCSPDFNAYEGGRVRPPPVPSALSGYRFAGGHIHVGGEFNCPEYVSVMFMDLIVGAPLALCEKPGKSGHLLTGPALRRQTYGAPGTYRPTKYGFEYRVPTNQWFLTDTIRWYTLIATSKLATMLSLTPAQELRKQLLTIQWTKVRNLIINGHSGITNAKAQLAQLLRPLPTYLQHAAIEIFTAGNPHISTKTTRPYPGASIRIDEYAATNWDRIIRPDEEAQQ